MNPFEEELRQYFTSHKNCIVNKNNVTIELGKQDCFNLKLLLKKNKAGMTYELYDEVQGISAFIETYKIDTLEALDSIDKSILRSRYLAENAEVIFTNGDKDSIHFRLFRKNTMVYSLDLKYYDEVYYHLIKLFQFKDYIKVSEDDLEDAFYKL